MSFFFLKYCINQGKVIKQDQENVDKLLKLCRICSEIGDEMVSKKYREEILVLQSVGDLKTCPQLLLHRFVGVVGKTLIVAKSLLTLFILVTRVIYSKRYQFIYIS